MLDKKHFVKENMNCSGHNYIKHSTFVTKFGVVVHFTRHDARRSHEIDYVISICGRPHFHITQFITTGNYFSLSFICVYIFVHRLIFQKDAIIIMEQYVSFLSKHLTLQEQ